MECEALKNCFLPDKKIKGEKVDITDSKTAKSLKKAGVIKEIKSSKEN